jgi:hypothetical protein
MNTESQPLQGRTALTLAEATSFFSEFYQGEHHIPGKIKPYGDGWVVNHDRGGIATYDYDQLTRLVFMAHERCVRVEVSPSSPRHLKIAIWKREREGTFSVRHPDLQTAIEKFNKK